MTESVTASLVRATLVAVLCGFAGFAGILDPPHAVLLGCTVFVALGLKIGPNDRNGRHDWPVRRYHHRAGGRDALSDLAWHVVDVDRRVRDGVVERVRNLAAARLALHGVDTTDPAQRTEVERLLGTQVTAGLFSGRRPNPRTLQIWLDAIDRLDHEGRTTP